MKTIIIITFITVITVILTPAAYAQQATLSLSPSSGTFNRGCDFSLNIDLNTGGADTDGTDAILIYDPSRFTATSIQSGTIYPDYPGNNIDEASGKITVSGLASVSQAFSGQGTLATINFTVRDQASTGTTQVKFDFDPSDKAKTTDSNVVQRGTVADILNSVVDGNYTVGSGTCAVGTGTGTGTTGVGQGATGVGVATPSGAPIYYKTLPEGGTPELTATFIIVGSVLTILGILGLVLL
ncbi:hypothetical protein HYT18_04150 [Candidatus Microgenomates bacterium]|nr:hypothetical protein [Candidatus Microgenomates bacterium]